MEIGEGILNFPMIEPNMVLGVDAMRQLQIGPVPPLLVLGNAHLKKADLGSHCPDNTIEIWIDGKKEKNGAAKVNK